MWKAFEKIKVLPCDLKYGLPFLITVQFVISLITNGLAFDTFNGYYHFDKSIGHAHLFVAAVLSVAFYYGMKHQDKYYLLPWLGFKLIEGQFLLGCSLTAHYRLVCVIVGITLYVFNMYILLSVVIAYKKMTESPAAASNGQSDLFPEKPPSYDQFTNQLQLP